MTPKTLFQFNDAGKWRPFDKQSFETKYLCWCENVSVYFMFMWVAAISLTKGALIDTFGTLAGRAELGAASRHQTSLCLTTGYTTQRPLTKHSKISQSNIQLLQGFSHLALNCKAVALASPGKTGFCRDSHSFALRKAPGGPRQQPWSRLCEISPSISLAFELRTPQWFQWL